MHIPETKTEGAAQAPITETGTGAAPAATSADTSSAQAQVTTAPKKRMSPREFYRIKSPEGRLTEAHMLVGIELYQEGGRGLTFSMDAEAPRAFGTVWIGPEWVAPTGDAMTPDVLGLLTTKQDLRYLPAAEGRPPSVFNEHAITRTCSCCGLSPAGAMARLKRDLATEGKAIVFDRQFILAAYAGKNRREARAWCPLCKEASMKVTRASVATGAEIPDEVLAAMVKAYNAPEYNPDSAVLPRTYGIVLHDPAKPPPMVVTPGENDWSHLNLAARVSNLEHRAGRGALVVPAATLSGLTIRPTRWSVSTTVDLDTGKPGVAVGWVTRSALLGGASLWAGMRLRLLGGTPLAQLDVRRAV